MKIDISDLKDLDALASKIATKVSKGKYIITLEGELGAGKTTFTQHLLKHLGVKTHIPSPTYNVLNEYQTETQYIVHADLYRLDSEDSLDLLGWDIVRQKANLIIVEWPKDFIDDADIQMHFEDGNKRTVYVTYN